MNPRIASNLISNISKDFGKDNVYVFDGNAVLYTKVHFLKDGEKLVLHAKDNSDDKYEITIKYACLISSESVSNEVKQLFNIMYRRALLKLKLQQIGRSHYNLNQALRVDKHNCLIAPV
jgi:hypothetical protein